MHPGALVLFAATQGCVPDALPDVQPERVGGPVAPVTEVPPSTEEPEPEPPPDLGDYERLFDLSILQDIRLTLEPASIDTLDEDGSVWVPAEFEHDGNVLEVGVHLKGTTTYRSFSGKPAFRVKFNEFVPGQKYASLKRLGLNNMLTDPAQGREVVAWLAWAGGGMPVPRATFARVYVNDEYFGLYAMIEGMDGEFLERRYEDPSGSLWAANDHADITPEGIAYFDLSSGDESGRAGLAHAAEVIGEWSTDLLTPASTVIDMDQYLDFKSWAMATGWNDGYPYHYNDYFVYADPADGGRLQFAPWGLDEAWSDTWAFDYGTGVLGWRCAQDPACGDALRVHAAEVLNVYESLGVAGRAEALFRVSEQATIDDPRKEFTSDEVLSARARLIETIARWPDKVRGATGL